jgi:hypothetical protein
MLPLMAAITPIATLTAVVQDPIEMIDQHVGQFLHRSQPLPTQLIPRLRRTHSRNFLDPSLISLR